MTQDQSYFWVEAHLRVNPGMTHDLEKPVSLVAVGHLLEPADTTFGSTNGQGTTDIWLKFWLQREDIAGPLTLQLNEGKLSIKATEGIPPKSKYYISNHW